MKRLIRFYLCLFLVTSFFGNGAFSLGGKIPSIPMKTYPVTDIKDGEFLHFGLYKGGEKMIDEYFVTIKEKNERGGFYYRVYEDFISPAVGRKLSANYTVWPVSILLDPVRCSTIVSEANFSTNDLKDGKGLIYSHYQFYPDKSLVKYISKSINGNEILTKSYTIKVRPDFPLVDTFSSSYAYRFIDPHSPGILYYVLPDFMKEPIPLTFRYDKKETIATKAGTFLVNNIIVILGDPFLGKLMAPFLKNFNLMIEDSDRRSPVKQLFTGAETVLEEISNVNVR